MIKEKNTSNVIEPIESLISNINNEVLGQLRTIENTTSLDLEREINNKKDFLWHMCQSNYSNRVEVLSNVFSKYIEELYVKSEQSEFLVMELGCRGGEVLSSLLSLNKTSESSFYYFGLDTNEEILKYATLNIKKHASKISASFSNLNIPLEEINWSESELNLLIFNNVSYYTYEIKDFIHDLFLIRSKNKKVMFVNESPLSDLSYLRNRFGSDVNARNYNELTTSLKNNKISCNKEYFDIKISFPIYEEDIWTNLYAMDCKKDHSMNPKFIEAKALLEYIVQRPLEFLLEEGLLKQYLDKVRVFLKEQNNQIISRNTLLLIN